MINILNKKNILIITLIIIGLITAAVLLCTNTTKQIKNENYEESFTGVNYESELENLPELSAKHCIVTEYESNRILYEKNAFNKSAMASTTKIMTALIVIEECNMTDIVTVSKTASAIGGSEINLKTGEEISVENLLYGLLLESGNDAAIALAEHTADSIEEFCILMNKKAKNLGAQNTNFTSPHGLDNENHFTTAYDLSIITKEALKNEIFRKIISTKTYTAGNRHFVNTNALLGTVDGVDGVKTGFTNNAGRCIVLTAERSGMRIIVVLFGCPDSLNRTIDGKRIIECIFENYKIYDVLPQSIKLGSLDTKKSKTEPSELVTNESVRLPLTENEYKNLSYSAEIFNNVYSVDINNAQNNNIEIFINKNSYKNSVCGYLFVKSGNKTIYKTAIAQSSDVIKKTYKDYLMNVLNEFAYFLSE
ncbi:MAG: D-alanyl-D-alanine carboxypeptidase [Clostridia bacterium]|nr:D-alanyl-D-alanine carboxypeptidase [Clostridia bacterium]